MIIAPGATSRSITVYAYDATTGLPYTSAAYNDAGIALWYRRGVTGAKTAITPATLSALTDAYSSGGFKAIAENAYRLDVPDAGLASGADMVTIGGSATAWKLIPMEIGLETPQTGDSFARIGAAGAGLTAVADTSGTTTLLSRLSSARAGYLDNLSAGAVALASALTTAASDVTTLLGRLTSARAGYLDNLSAGAAALASALASAAADITTLLGRLTSTRAGYLDNLSGGAPATAANVWAYAARTLTQGAASVTAAVTGSGVTVYRGTRWSITLTGLPTNTGYTSILFSAKHRADDTDAAAAVLVRKNSSGSGDGLIAFEGATVTAGQASITVVSATSITITVEAATTQYAAPGDYRYGIKYLDASGYPSQASIGGTFSIEADIPKAIT